MLPDFVFFLEKWCEVVGRTRKGAGRRVQSNAGVTETPRGLRSDIAWVMPTRFDPQGDWMWLEGLSRVVCSDASLESSLRWPCSGPSRPGSSVEGLNDTK